MIEIDLLLNRKARIWINKLPLVDFHPSFTLKKTIRFSNNSKPINLKRRQFAIELFIGAGGRIIHGLLGGESLPSENFSYEIYSTKNALNQYTETLLKGIDKVSVGLPPIFAQSVENGILNYLKNNPKISFCGKLIFSHAAFGEVGSSQDIFEKLSVISSTCFLSTKQY